MRFHSPFFVLWIFLLYGCRPDQNQSDREKVNAEIRKGYDYQVKADGFLLDGKSDSAFANYSRAKAMYEKAHDSIRLVYTLLKIGDIYHRYNDYNEMQATDVEALQFLKTSRDSSYHPTVYNQLGISFGMMGDAQNAEIHYGKGRSYVSSDWEQATLDNNIANAYLTSEDFKKAHSLLEKALSRYTLHDSIAIKAMILDNFGYAAFRSGKTDGEIPVLKALELRKASGDTFGLITNYLHLAEMRLPTQKTEAIRLAARAEELATATNSQPDRLQTLKFLVENSDGRQAAGYAKDFVRISDSLEKARMNARNAFAKIKYDFKNEREERLQTDLERVRERNAKLNWIIALISFVSVAAFFIYYLIRRNRNIRQKATYDAEVRISAQLHDGLANEVHKTIVFTETRNLSDETNKETLLQRLETIYEGTRSVSRGNSEIPHDDLGQALRDLLTEYNSDDCAVIAQGIANVDWARMESHKRVEFYRIVQELLANMRKHSGCSHALFLFGMNGKNVSLSYSDNGTGGNKNGQNRKNGLRIMENRISGLKGTLNFEAAPGNGFRAYIQFPL